MTTDSIIDFDISGLPETSEEAFKQALQTQKQTMEQSYNQLKEQIKDVTGPKRYSYGRNEIHPIIRSRLFECKLRSAKREIDPDLYV